MPCGTSSWLTAKEIADLGMPGLPDDRRRIAEWAGAHGWDTRADADGNPLARRRAARGGGIEYHISLLPLPAQEALMAWRRRDEAKVLPIPANDPPANLTAVAKWGWYDRQSASIKAKAINRLSMLMEVETLRDAGTTQTSAINVVATRHGVSPRAIAGWFADVAGVSASDRLPFLAPRYQGGGKEVEIDPTAWQILKSDYLRPEKPSFAACYNRLVEDYARPNGVTLPSAKTLQRRMDAEITKSLKTLKRDGREASRRAVPPQQRSVADLHAMEVVNVDGHTFDLFVQWEDGRIGRPVMVGIQDVYSRKLLAYRIGETECTLLTRMAFADLFRVHGIPVHAVLDNGRAFASKALTGGAATRFRFKIKDTDATGVLTALGIKTHWTLPYRGSSKPIERTWRDVCEDIAKHPAVAGAYTGNKPDAKPENYRERAIPIAEFRAHVAQRVATLNARAGRRTEAAQGGSFDDAFAASFEVSPIGRATADQLRLALLMAEDRRCDRASGTVTLAGNRYWSEDMIDLAGENVALRFDPDNLHAGVHVYRANGDYVGHAPAIDATGFLDKAGSIRRAKLENNVRRKLREAEQAAQLLHVDQVAEIYAGSQAPTAPTPEPSVVRPVRHRGQTAAALKPIPQADAAPVVPSFIDDFAAGVARLRIVE